MAQAFTEALKRGPYSELGPVDDAALTQVDQAAHEAATSPLKDHYGYFKLTNAKDGDHVDVFVKPGTPEDYQGPIHVIRQNKVEGVRAQDLEKRRGGDKENSESQVSLSR